MGFSLGNLGSGSFLGTLIGGGLGFAVGGPLGAGIGASLLGTAGSNYDNNKAIDEQNAYNLRLWQMQNEYNTPANQVARLREAGLNPNLFYSQGNPGNATSAPDMKAHQYSAAQFLDLANMYYSVKNLQAQNNNLNAQTANIEAQTRARNMQSDVEKLQLDYFRRYGVFPNQSNSSVLRQILIDVFKGFSGADSGQGAVGHSSQAVGAFVGNQSLKHGARMNRLQQRGDFFRGSYSTK